MWLSTRPAQFLPPLVLALSLLGAAAAAYRTAERNRTEVDASLARETERVALRISERFKLYEYGLRGARGAVLGAGTEAITPQRFAAYIRSRNVEEEFPGAQGFGFIRRVPVEQASSFEKARSQNGRPGFRIRQIAPHAGERYVIDFIEPLQPNQAAVGLDIASEPLRRAGAELALRSGSPTLTAPITLVQAGSAENRGFLLMLPVAELPDGAAEAAPPVGWVYAPLVIDRVLADLDVVDHVSWRLEDVQDGERRLLFHSTPAPAAEATTEHGYARNLVIGQRRWQLSLTPLPGFATGQPSPWRPAATVAMFGALIAGLLMAAMASARQQATRASQAEVESARNQLQTLIDNMPAAIGYVDHGHIVRYANRPWRQAFELSSAAESGHSVKPLPALPGDEARVAAVLAGQAQDFEQVLRLADGAERTFHFSYIPDQRDGKVHGFFVQALDISERRLAEQRLRDSEERFRLLVDGASEHAIVMLDAQGRIESWNPGAAQQRGYGADEVLGRSHAMFYGAEEAAQGRPAADLAMARDNGRAESEGWRTRKDGSRFWANVVISALYDEQGSLRGYCKITRDLSERHRRELELEHAQQLARSAARAKSEFVAAMSHELRTPMSAVLGYAELLLKGRFGAINERQTEFLNLILGSGRNLMRLIDDVLDLAKIDSEKLVLRIERFEPRKPIDGVVAVVGSMAVRKRIAVQVEVDAAVGEVCWDESRFKQILFNLLSNAVKFSQEQGRVRLSLVPDGMDILVLEVSDTGIGIPLAEQDRLFGRFEQVGPGAGGRPDGAGLGLVLTRRLVELHGGSIGMTSVPGQGTTLTVRMPRDAGNLPEPPTGRAGVPDIEALELEVHKRRLAEQQLLDSEQNLSVALASMGAAFLAADREGRVTRMNSVAEQLLGWTQAEALGRGLFEVFVREGRPPELSGRNPVDIMIEQSISIADVHHVVAVGRHGRSIEVEVKAAVTYSEDGSIRGLAMVFRDVGPSTKAETDANRLAAIVESSSDAIVGKTLDGHITSWNRAAELLFGYSADEAIGQSVQMLIPPDRADEEMRILADLRNGIAVPAFDTERLTKDGRQLAVSVTISPVRDGQGRIVGAAKIARRAAERRGTEQATGANSSDQRPGTTSDPGS